jgi:hypothetical protein
MKKNNILSVLVVGFLALHCMPLAAMELAILPSDIPSKKRLLLKAGEAVVGGTLLCKFAQAARDSGAPQDQGIVKDIANYITNSLAIQTHMLGRALVWHKAKSKLKELARQDEADEEPVVQTQPLASPPTEIVAPHYSGPKKLAADEQPAGEKKKSETLVGRAAGAVLIAAALHTGVPVLMAGASSLAWHARSLASTVRYEASMARAAQPYPGVMVRDSRGLQQQVFQGIATAALPFMYHVLEGTDYFHPMGIAKYMASSLVEHAFMMWQGHYYYKFIGSKIVQAVMQEETEDRPTAAPSQRLATPLAQQLPAADATGNSDGQVAPTLKRAAEEQPGVEEEETESLLNPRTLLTGAGGLVVAAATLPVIVDQLVQAPRALLYGYYGAYSATRGFHPVGVLKYMARSIAYGVGGNAVLEGLGYYKSLAVLKIRDKVMGNAQSTTQPQPMEVNAAVDPATVNELVAAQPGNAGN